MKVSGFTFIKNGQVLGYPFMESIQSILPIVDEFVINIGESEDDTLDMILSIKDKKFVSLNQNGMMKCEIEDMFMVSKK